MKRPVFFNDVHTITIYLDPFSNKMKKFTEYSKNNLYFSQKFIIIIRVTN